MVWELVSPGFSPTEMRQGYSRLNAGEKLVGMVSLFLGTVRRGAIDFSRMRILEPGCLGLNPVLPFTKGVAWSKSYHPSFSHLYKRVKKSPSQHACLTSM